MYSQMPMYNRNHEAYFKQMYEWHNQMSQYQEQLRKFHEDRANQFRGMVNEKETVTMGNGTT
ncbi:hypothetical protein [Paenibacillus sp. GP183]|uniref:hypothetical protein n=1 Tax=Paenibacillus sp. GP183 TaxID=1882751 RepID=UPI00089958D6|nr:hypothetical protein [Paenibacillus sp. GP183]SEC76018.1 hypothetical protein SAMN05443246_5274 [Paenibacillus sp. GP183]